MTGVFFERGKGAPIRRVDLIIKKCFGSAPPSQPTTRIRVIPNEAKRNEESQWHCTQQCNVACQPPTYHTNPCHSEWSEAEWGIGLNHHGVKNDPAVGEWRFFIPVLRIQNQVVSGKRSPLKSSFDSLNRFLTSLRRFGMRGEAILLQCIVTLYGLTYVSHRNDNKIASPRGTRLAMTFNPILFCCMSAPNLPHESMSFRMKRSGMRNRYKQSRKQSKVETRLIHNLILFDLHLSILSLLFGIQGNYWSIIK